MCLYTFLTIYVLGLGRRGLVPIGWWTAWVDGPRDGPMFSNFLSVVTMIYCVAPKLRYTVHRGQ